MPDAEGRMNPGDAELFRRMMEGATGQVEPETTPEQDPEEFAYIVEQERQRAAEVRTLTGGTVVTDRRRFK
jgi:hypothetical protein